MNTVAASFNTTMGQMTEMSQRKKTGFNAKSVLELLPPPLTDFLDFILKLSFCFLFNTGHYKTSDSVSCVESVATLGITFRKRNTKTLKMCCRRCYVTKAICVQLTPTGIANFLEAKQAENLFGRDAVHSSASMFGMASNANNSFVSLTIPIPKWEEAPLVHLASNFSQTKMTIWRQRSIARC